MNKTSIEWTHRPGTVGMTWNPIRARLKGQGPFVHSGTFCTRISPGCTNCYASTINKRFGNGLEYTVPNLERIEFFLNHRMLEEPLYTQKPCTIFVGDMFDLFHEAIPTNLISDVLLMMQAAKQHTFQLLTKRAARMQEVLSFAFSPGPPPPHIWAGVSVEDQSRADERIPLLLQTPIAVRFLSVEPMLEAVNMEPDSIDGMPTVNVLRGADWCDPPIPAIDWVICGGESGPGARPFNLAWAESLLKQCKAAGVPFFMKQVGSSPYKERQAVGRDSDGGKFYEKLRLRDRKGGDASEWPWPLRVREFPTSQKAETVSA